MKSKRLIDADVFALDLETFKSCLLGEPKYGKSRAKVVEMVLNMLHAAPTIQPESLIPLTYNENMDYLDCDEFVCHKCSIRIEDWSRIKTDDDGQEQHYEYTFKHCPECGAKIIEHKSCEFCRWHIPNGTCFRDSRNTKRIVQPEYCCGFWEERE